MDLTDMSASDDFGVGSDGKAKVRITKTSSFLVMGDNKHELLDIGNGTRGKSLASSKVDETHNHCQMRRLKLRVWTYFTSYQFTVVDSRTSACVMHTDKLEAGTGVEPM